MLMAFGPLIRTIPMAPAPFGVAMAAMEDWMRQK